MDGIWWQNGFLLLGLIVWVLMLLYVAVSGPSEPKSKFRR